MQSNQDLLKNVYELDGVLCEKYKNFISLNLKEDLDENRAIFAGSARERSVACRLFKGTLQFETDIMFEFLQLEDENDVKYIQGKPGFVQVRKRDRSGLPSEQHISAQEIKDFGRNRAASAMQPYASIPIFQITIDENGPAVTTTVNFMGISFSNDFVSAVGCTFWPSCAVKWIARQNRSWLKRHQDKIKKEGCHIVPKTSIDDVETEWRFSFSKAESSIVNFYSEKMKQVYFIFKSLFYYHLGQLPMTRGKRLPSYVVKTIMLWECEEKGLDKWENFSILECVQILFQRLRHVLNIKKLQHYFIIDVNIFEDYPDELLLLAEEKVKTVLRDFRQEGLLASITENAISTVKNQTQQLINVFEFLTVPSLIFGHNNIPVFRRRISQMIQGHDKDLVQICMQILQLVGFRGGKEILLKNPFYLQFVFELLNEPSLQSINIL